jgi:hypothetical protein
MTYINKKPEKRSPSGVFEEIRAKLRQYCLETCSPLERAAIRKELKQLEDEYERLTGKRPVG